MVTPRSPCGPLSFGDTLFTTGIYAYRACEFFRLTNPSTVAVTSTMDVPEGGVAVHCVAVHCTSDAGVEPKLTIVPPGRVLKFVPTIVTAPPVTPAPPVAGPDAGTTAAIVGKIAYVNHVLAVTLLL